MKLFVVLLTLDLCLAAQDGWKRMFDGKTLDGWKANENAASWSVRNGAITGDGERSHLFYMREQCTNCEFKAELRLNHGGNSGMYFRAKLEPGWPTGYEAQVNNTHGDPVRTGSLYNFVKILDQLVPDDTWWTQQVTANGNHIVIKVNDKVTVDYIDDKNTYASGYLALQQHNKGSVVEYRNLMMRALPAGSALAGVWKLNREKSRFSVGELPRSILIYIEPEGDGIRYTSSSVLADGRKGGARYTAKLDGKDYPLAGSGSYNSVAIKAAGRNAWHVEDKKDGALVVSAKYTVANDGRTLVREGTAKRDSGESNQFYEVFERM